MIVNRLKHICQRFQTVFGQSKPKGLDLGGAAGLKQLHVIMRTTDRVMNINATRNLEDIGILTRNDVIRVGGCSLFKTAEQFAKTFGPENIRITIVADNLSEKGMTQYCEAAAPTGLAFDVVEMEDHGNAPSFHKGPRSPTGHRTAGRHRWQAILPYLQYLLHLLHAREPDETSRKTSPRLSGLGR